MADHQHNDIELAEDASATEHGTKQNVSVAVKWFFNGNWRRFQCSEWTYSALQAEIRTIEPNFSGQLFYRDADGDAIVFTTDAEMRVMLDHFQKKMNKDTVTLETMGGEGTVKTGVVKTGCPYINKIGKMRDVTYNGTGDKSLHPHIMCDLCDGGVVGIRYKCMVCPDFDLCEQCEKTGVHAEHAMCRLATTNTPKPIGLPMRSLFPLPAFVTKDIHEGIKKGHETIEALNKRIAENNQKFAAKMEKLERKHAKHVARKEQRVQDRAARVQHRLERTAAKSQTEPPQRAIRHLGVPPSAPPVAEVDKSVQQPEKISNNINATATSNNGNGSGNAAQQPQHPQPLHGGVDYLLGIGQSVQRALMNFGIECDAEVRDERGVVRGAVPFRLPTQKSDTNGTTNGKTNGGIETQPKKTTEKTSAFCPFVVNQAPVKEGILQRPQWCSTNSSRGSNANPPNSANSSSSSANTPSAPLPPRPALDQQQQAALMAAIAMAQDTVKKTLPVALSGLEATSAVIGEFLSGFDPSTGQAANRVGQTVVSKARQGVENLTEMLSPEFAASILQLPTPVVVPPTNNGQTNGEPQQQTDEKKTADKLSPNAIPDNNTSINSEAASVDQNLPHLMHRMEELQTKLMSLNMNLANRNRDEIVNDGKEKEEAKKGDKAEDEANKEEEIVVLNPYLYLTNEAMEKMEKERKEKDSAEANSDTTTANSLDKEKQPTAPIQLGNKRKLGDGVNKDNGEEDLMKLNTHNSEEPVDNGNVAYVSSFSSRSSTTTMSSVEDEEDSGTNAGDDGWMVVKKESFKKLCDFYEKRRRVECGGGTVAADPFAEQLEREFREATMAENNRTDERVDEKLTAESEPKKADESVKEVGQEPAAEVSVAQIVDLTTEKDGKSEKSEKTIPCVHSVVMRGVCAGCGQDFRQPNEFIGNSAAIFNIEQQQQKTNQAVPISRSIGVDDHQQSAKSIYPSLELLEKEPRGGTLMGCVDGEEVCTAGLPYPGYQKPKGQKHSRHCEWKHKNLVIQSLVEQLVGMGFDNCNGWLFRVAEKEGAELDRIFVAIDEDTMYRARISLQ
ncbi:hypothetical protein niasHS_006424 [Heterodera schachtii]|uniref:ZZ-type domain-containing protein n=1 Tax=Heterodera schachtii TaxID=97005 RepID=A0ABD2JHB0_HETSC